MLEEIDGSAGSMLPKPFDNDSSENFSMFFVIPYVAIHLCRYY